MKPRISIRTIIAITVLVFAGNTAYALLRPTPLQSQGCPSGCVCHSWPSDPAHCGTNCGCFPNPLCLIDAPGNCVN